MENVTVEMQRDERETLNGEVALCEGEPVQLEVDCLVTCATLDCDGHFICPFYSPQFLLSFKKRSDFS